MPTVEERYAAATAYVRRAITGVEQRGIAYAVSPITGLVEWYAGRDKTEPARNDLSHIEARWLRATSDQGRTKVARDAELLADRTQESLPGAPQDRQRTNLWKGEQPTSTPATGYYGEVANQAAGDWDWVKDRASGLASGATSVGRWLLVGGGVLLAWKAAGYLRERERRREIRAAGSTRRALNTNLERVARDAGPKATHSKALRRRLDETELVTWFERDRAHVELRDSPTGQTIVEWWDDEVRQAIEDGFLPHRWSETAARAAAFEYAKHVGLIEEARDAGTAFTTTRRRAPPYSIQLTKGEIEALYFLRSRYTSAEAFVDGLVPLDDSADRALGQEFDRNNGPYRFQIPAADVRKALRATQGDGGDYGAIPNLRSATVDWVLAAERRRTP